MKKVALSALAAAMISGVASADALTLYSDPKTGQVYTTPGEGRVEMGDFISAKDVDMSQRESESAFSEYKENMKKYTNVTSKAKKIEFSGTHYLGYTYADTKAEGAVNPANSAGFEMRRNYVQVKGYFNDKDYVRVTMDATKELASDPGSTSADLKTSQGGGYADVFIKYAYLYLDNVLPYTGVEAGIAHRPWIDYEEHNGWYYRSFAKVLIEPKATATENGPDLVNSADFGVNFKTKMDMFSSEIGIYNGEGYHADKEAANQEATTGMSLEWRLTGHLIGSGEKVGKNDRTKDTYAHISSFGLISKNHKDEKAAQNQTDATAIIGKLEYDRDIFGFHAVYNQPEFLIAAQYVMAEDDYRASNAKKSTSAWSINGEYRPIQDWTVIGRYDHVKQKNENDVGTSAVNGYTMDLEKIMYGVAYKYNKNVTFLATSTQSEDPKLSASDRTKLTADKNVYQLTTEIKW